MCEQKMVSFFSDVKFNMQVGYPNRHPELQPKVGGLSSLAKGSDNIAQVLQRTPTDELTFLECWAYSHSTDFPSSRKANCFFSVSLYRKLAETALA